MLSAWCLTPAGILVVVWVWRSGRRTLPAARLAARLLLAGYLTWLAGQAFFPIPVGGDAVPPEGAGALITHVRLVPLLSIHELVQGAGQWESLRILLGNVLLFVPLGFLLPAATARAATWPRAVAAGIATGLVIELGQLALSAAAAFPYRYVETDDVLLNALGVLAGYALWTLSTPVRRKTVARCGGRC